MIYVVTCGVTFWTLLRKLSATIHPSLYKCYEISEMVRLIICHYVVWRASTGSPNLKSPLTLKLSKPYFLTSFHSQMFPVEIIKKSLFHCGNFKNKLFDCLAHITYRNSTLFYSYFFSLRSSFIAFNFFCIMTMTWRIMRDVILSTSLALEDHKAYPWVVPQ